MPQQQVVQLLLSSVGHFEFFVLCLFSFDPSFAINFLDGNCGYYIISISVEQCAEPSKNKQNPSKGWPISCGACRMLFFFC